MLFLLFFYSLFSSALADRRVLHEPFFPVDSPPQSPPQSPPPPLPKLPFSSTTPPDATSPPFFPTYPSPPPPPSPASFASFPANISSLIVPHATKSPPNSKKLLIVAISAVTSAALVAALIALLYWRRRTRSSSQESNAPDDSKTWTTDSSRRVYPPPPSSAAPSARRNAEGRVSKQRTTTTTRSSANTSSEFLYLGTMVNPRGVEDHQSESRSNRSNNGSSSRKLESPDLQPLPPLMKRSFRLNPEVGSIGEEEEEEFYSPRGSASGRVGSESRRVFAAVTNQNASRSVNNDTISCSSSSSGSPGRSTFISISPSMSPKRSEPKETVISAPEPPPKTSPGSSESSPAKITDFRLVRSPSLSLASLSPRLLPAKIADGGGGGLGQISRSPTVTSLTTTSPERENNKKEENTLQNLDDDDDSPRSSSRSSSASTSPERRPNDTPEAYLRSPTHSSASTSPYRCFQKSPEVLPAFMSNLRQGLQSQLLSSPGQGFLSELDALRDEKASHKSPEKASHSPQSASSSSLSSSPDRDFSHSLDVSPRISNISSQILQPPVASAATVGGSRVPPPPPPPPPSFPTWARRNNTKAASRPPPLTPPSNPFVIPSENLPKKTSPEETQKETFSDANDEPAEETPKPKLKALHWDKVRASSDREMVWDQLRSSSFK